MLYVVIVMTPRFVHLFPHRCHSTGDRAGLSNYQDLLDILHLNII